MISKFVLIPEIKVVPGTLGHEDQGSCLRLASQVGLWLKPAPWLPGVLFLVSKQRSVSERLKSMFI